MFEKYQNLYLDGSCLGLEPGPEKGDYFCTPIGAKVIGWENGGIHYCFLPNYGEMVFAVNPLSCVDANVYPLAANFTDFLRLLLACGSTTVIEQIIWMTEEQFLSFLSEEWAIASPEKRNTLKIIEEQLELTPMKKPFTYVKQLQASFDYSHIQYAPEYYETLDIECPSALGNETNTHCAEANTFTWEVSFEIDKKKTENKSK